MSSSISLKIDGKDVRPETVSLSDLIALLQKFNHALKTTAESGGMSKEDFGISLVSIDEGSDILNLEANASTFYHAERLTSAIRTRDLSKIPTSAIQEIHEIWKYAQRRDWSIELNCGNDVLGPAIIFPDVPVWETSLHEGATSVVGYVLRVGNKRPTAFVRLTSGQTLAAKVSQDLAKKLGALLYSHVQLNGIAVWSSPNQELIELRVTSIGPYFEAESDPVGALEAIYEISPSFWDNAEPDSLRTDDFPQDKPR